MVGRDMINDKILQLPALVYMYGCIVNEHVFSVGSIIVIIIIIIAVNTQKAKCGVKNATPLSNATYRKKKKKETICIQS